MIGAKGGTLTGQNVLYYWNFGTATTPLFHKDSVNTFFGGIKVSNYHIGYVAGYGTPFIMKEGSNTVLYSGSQDGITLKFLINPDSLRHGTFTLLDSNVLPDRPGLRSTVYVADINHDGKNDYLTGNIRGGLMLYSDSVWKTAGPSGINDPNTEYNEIEVFPIPAHGKLLCRIVRHDAEIINTTLYNLLGEAIATPSHTSDDNTLILDVNAVAEGIYILQVQDSKGKLYQRKVSIY